MQRIPRFISCLHFVHLFLHSFTHLLFLPSFPLPFFLSESFDSKFETVGPLFLNISGYILITGTFS